MLKNVLKLNYHPRPAPNTLHPPIIDTSSLARNDSQAYQSIIDAITSLVSSN